jgi:hypothetical protein
MQVDDFIYLVKAVITGRIDKKIKHLEKKYKEPWPEDMYFNLTGVSYTGIYTSKTNNISDPTGGQATRLADIKLQQKRTYEYYYNFKQITLQILNNLEPYLINNIRKYLKIDPGKLTHKRKMEAMEYLNYIRINSRNNNIHEDEVKPIRDYNLVKRMDKAVKYYSK